MVGRNDIARGSVELASVKCIARKLCVNLHAWCKGHSALKMKYQAGQGQMAVSLMYHKGSNHRDRNNPVSEDKASE